MYTRLICTYAASHDDKNVPNAILLTRSMAGCVSSSQLSERRDKFPDVTTNRMRTSLYFTEVIGAQRFGSSFHITLICLLHSKTPCSLLSSFHEQPVHVQNNPFNMEGSRTATVFHIIFFNGDFHSSIPVERIPSESKAKEVQSLYSCFVTSAVLFMDRSIK